MGLLKNDLAHLIDKVVEIDSYKSKWARILILLH